MGFGFVALQPLPHQLVNELLVLSALHIDKVADDQSTDVSKSQLARNFISRLQIRLQNCLFYVACAFVAAGIHVDRNERFGLINDNVTAASQPNLTMESVVDLFLHTEGFENRGSTVVKMKPVARTP